MKNKIWVVTGSQGSGKTSYLLEIVEFLQTEGFRLGGFIAKGTWKNNKRYSFELLDLQTNQQLLFCQSEPVTAWKKIEHFYINPAGQHFGETVLDPKNLQGIDLVVIDEIGPFELKGKGWAEAIDRIMEQTRLPMIWTIREGAVMEVLEKWNFRPLEIIHVEKTNIRYTQNLLKNELKK